ncbi:MAG: hypothetical protein Fur0046_19750 [Cyanobacteria bacterium J069]|nr:MAG: hypothetical protein D6742_09720 [Cyanobacteria bacterium J069]
MNSNTPSNTVFPKQNLARKPSLWQRLQNWVRQDIVADDPWDVETYFPEEEQPVALHKEPVE